MRYLISNQPNLFDLKGFTVIDVDKSIEILSRWPEVQVDTETTGLVHTTDKILLLQLGIYEDQLLYDIASFNGQIPDKLKAYMNNDDRLYLGQNIKFDLKFLFWQGVWLKKVYDTMIVEQMINNDGEKIAGRNSLDGLTRKYCQVELDKSIRGDIIKYGLNSAVLDYGAKDVTYLGKIRDGQMKVINEWDMGKAVEIENQAILFIAYMEFCGVKLDSEKWMEKCAKDTKNKLDSISALNKWLMDNGHMEFFDGAADLFTGERACKINWSSQKQVIPVFEKLGLDLWVEEKGTRKKSISEKYIAKYAKTYPLVALYLDYQGYTKLCSTYGMNWFDMIDGQTDRIHTVFHQLGTNTGRLSSGNSRENKPNLQNLPNDAFTRSCFCAEEGSKICATDFSGQEQIVLANFSLEPNLIAFYEQKLGDMHSYNAKLMFSHLKDKTLKEIKNEYKHERSLAKSCGFAINYGGDGSTIAKNCNLTVAKGKEVYDSYFKAYPKLKEYFDMKYNETVALGYIRISKFTNRRFLLSDNNPFVKYRSYVEGESFWEDLRSGDTYAKSCQSDYNKAKSSLKKNSMNYPIQGSSAELSKLAGIFFYRWIVQNNYRNIVKIVNMVHDSPKICRG